MRSFSSNNLNSPLYIIYNSFIKLWVIKCGNDSKLKSYTLNTHSFLYIKHTSIKCFLKILLPCPVHSVKHTRVLKLSSISEQLSSKCTYQ